MANQFKARVFISCGQNRDTNEVEIAHRIAEKLTVLSYEPYIAVEEQTLKGVKENIFSQLSNSEYFIFVDFKREKIGSWGSKSFRGSLFSNQELALASFLDIPIIAFQEVGVRKEDGLMKFIQGNVTPFSDRHLLPDAIAHKVSEIWNAEWKNQLCIQHKDNQFVDANVIVNGTQRCLARFFQVDVFNAHSRRAALNCYAYLENLKDLRLNKEIPLKAVEFKWSGYIYPNAIISPNSVRKFDAFHVLHLDPKQLLFNLFTDSTEYIPRVQGPGEFEFTYVVVSENFIPERRSFKLIVGTTLDSIKFSLL